MQQEDEEEERTGQSEGRVGDETIPADNQDEPMRKEEEKATSLEGEPAFEDALTGRHVDVILGGIPCSNRTTILDDHMEEPTVELGAANHNATEVVKRTSFRARRGNSLYKGFVMG